jgi:NAD(P)-dependent dehydrogenase (short-subunit alcohol dehydrogenase family)
LTGEDKHQPKGGVIMIRRYQGAVAVITGGASGIGRALGETLSRRGAEVVLADLQAELAEQIASGIRTAGGKATAAALDVRNFTAFDGLVREVVSRHGRIDYLFNNAGIGIGGRVQFYGIENWDRVIDVNVRGVTNGVQAVYSTMLRQGFGHIVNTASLAALMPTPGLVGYGMSKHAVLGLSTSLRAESEGAGIRVSVLCPGAIRTPALEWGMYHEALEEMDPEQQRRIIERLHPMEPAAFAEAALRAVARNKAIIVIPGRWKTAGWLNRVSPDLALYLARKTFERRVKALRVGDSERPQATGPSSGIHPGGSAGASHSRNR